MPVRRFHSGQVAQEEIPEPALAILAAGAVATVGHDQQVEVFRRINQRIHEAVGALWRHIVRSV